MMGLSFMQLLQLVSSIALLHRSEVDLVALDLKELLTLTELILVHLRDPSWTNGLI